MTIIPIILLSLAVVLTNHNIYRLMRRMEQIELRYIDRLLNHDEDL